MDPEVLKGTLLCCNAPSQPKPAPGELNLPTTVSSALAESWSRVVFVMQVYVPASFSVTSVMVRLSDSRINLKTESLQRGIFGAAGLQTYASRPGTRHLQRADLSSSGSSPASFSQVMVGVSVGSCFTLHSNTTDRPLWTTLYSGCFRILVGSDGKMSKRLRGGTFAKYSNRILKIGENCSAILHL